MEKNDRYKIEMQVKPIGYDRIITLVFHDVAIKGDTSKLSPFITPVHVWYGMNIIPERD